MAQELLRETNSPLNGEQARQLNQLLGTMRHEQMTWVSGYLAGLAAAGGAAANAPAPAVEPAQKLELTILYGSQTGNAEGVADLARERAEANGLSARVVDMLEFNKQDLKKADNLLVIVSTHGEGDPPDNAEDFYELVHGRKAPSLKGKRFSVLALGDSSYENFCQTGRDFDARLEALGAERVHDRVDCDVDFDEAASAWLDGVVGQFADLGGAATPAASDGVASSTSGSHWSRKNPFPATVLENICLSGRGSDKETRHIELSIEDSGLSFEPGDSLGVVAQNNPDYVDGLLQALALDPEAQVGGESLRRRLIRDREVTTITRPFLERYAEFTAGDALRDLLREDARPALREYMAGRHIIDVVRDFPPESVTPESLIEALRPLPPRLYSIASSYRAAPDEIHLTVGVVRYHSNGEDREGVASTFLADRVEEGETVPVYISPNRNFRLPEDPGTPVIMVGPGTGIAPFRAFLAEREEVGADGRNWLFFGDRRFHQDFLYQTDILQWRRRGLLDRVDVAFSRDQGEKIYVQDRMRENAADLYAWLQEGAHFYVCGDGERMATDVDRALKDILKEQGGLTEEDAAAYLKQMQKDKRYQRDVY